MLGMVYRLFDAIRRRYSSGNSGSVGEDLAHRYLRRRGCVIVARNYRTRSGAGEIDIVAWHGPTLVFVEVKTRRTAEYGQPESAVDAEKRARIVIGARDYARRSSVPFGITRFDVVSVLLEPRHQIEWLQNAFHAYSETAGAGARTL